MKKYSLIILAISIMGFFFISASNRAKDYSNLWKKVEQKESADLPKSAIEIVDQILNKSISDKNIQQAIKATIYKTKYESTIDQDKQTEIFAGLENLIGVSKNDVDKALLHSLLAELYINYYSMDSYTIGQRTDIVGTVPDDISTWSENIFFDKIIEHLKASVENENVLLKTPVDNYNDIIDIAEETQSIYPTMYDFLMNRAISISEKMAENISVSFVTQDLTRHNITVADLALPIDKFVKLDFPNNQNLAVLHYYSMFLKNLKDRNKSEAIVFTELNKNEFLSQYIQNYNRSYSLNFLQNLRERYAASEIDVEVIAAIVDQLGNYDYQYVNGDYVQDSVKIEKKYNLLKEGINKYPDYRRINILKEKLAILTRPKTSVVGKDVFYPTNKKQFTIDYRNVSEVEISIINDSTNILAWTKKIKLTPSTSYLNYKTSFDANLDKVGAYKMNIKSTDFEGVSKTDSLSFNISRITSFSRTLNQNALEFYVVDRKTGTPISNAIVSVYSVQYKSGTPVYTKLRSLNTDKQGLASVSSTDLPDKGSLYYRVNVGNDISNYNYCSRPYFYSDNNTSDNQKDKVSLFTDRSLYRPGQPVYYKAIVNGYDNNKQPVAIVKKECKVIFYNVNRQVVSETTLTTNEFGSIAGNFVIPKGGLTGMYIISVDGTETFISVEEYKRPTFEIVFDKLNKTYTYGDSVKITGYAQNFSGIKLENVSVDYDIVRNPFFRWWGNSPSVNIAEGTVKTNKDGLFEITFKIPQKEVSSSGIRPLSFYSNLFNFSITATATDLNGETQSGSTNLVVGDVSMILSADVPDKIERNAKSEIKVSAQNLDGQAVSAKGTYVIYSVLSNDSIDKKIESGQFDTQNITELNNNIEKLSSGKYQLLLKSNDDQGRLVEAKNYFIIYSMDDKRPPVDTNEWFIDKNAIFEGSKPAEIIVGVSYKNVTVLYDLMKGNKLISREQFVLSDENKKITILYKKEYEGNVTALFTYVIDEVVYQKQINVKKVSENNDLVLKWNVFRDKVRPGEKENWSIVVNDIKGNPAYAELLASMYDASLDKIQQTQNWYFSVALQNYTYTNPWGVANSYGNTNADSNFELGSFNVKAMQWNCFNWFNFSFESSLNYTFPVMRAVATVTGPVTMEEKYSSDHDTSEKPLALMQTADLKKVGMEDGGGEASAPQIRKNFDETAFFYPQLKTNSKGETVISFTVPESNTTWKFRALAYNQKFDIGRLDATVVSQKELMVTPNIPRFVRQGDKTSISTKISNLSDKSISGKVRIEFFNPITDEVNTDIKMENQYQNFSLDSGASSDASWLFDVPEGIDVLGCCIIAESESFSDGEQHAIPVLPNKMLVTESMTMNMNESGSKDFVFDRFVNNKSKSLTNYRLILEYANNPAWYAIQALPTISNPTNENAVNWFASYYANTLSQFIGKQYPKIIAAINSWKSKGGDKDSFISQLQKNEDLKAVLLEETPWVLDAKNETEQMQKLSLLFNLNNTSMQATTAISKLQDLQREDGGWAWFNGMNSNRGITLYLLYGFSELVNLNAVEYTSDIKEMQIKALKYLDDQIIADYNRLKSNNNKDWQEIKSIQSSTLEYLYVRSEYRDIPISQEARAAERFYTSVVEKNWQSLTYYQKSLLVVLAKRSGNKDLMTKLISSLKEHATVNEEMGMYWANNRSSAFMLQSAVTIHTFIMEAFKEAGADSKEMDLMKQWLLKQKQTQSWESTHATIDAIYALLSTGNNWFSTNTNAKIYVGKTLIEDNSQDNVLGYIEKSWSRNEITQSMGTVNIDRTASSPAWGAMYWQYFEDLNKITSDNDGEFTIDKKYFIEQNQLLQPLTSSNTPKVGDKITVRLTVKADRDFDFVQIKDLRPSCFEPISAISGFKFMNGVGYYQSTKDASTNFFFDVLPKGTYVFEYSVYINRVGTYSTGITTIQCMYAPQFVSHTSGQTLIVK